MTTPKVEIPEDCACHWEMKTEIIGFGTKTEQVMVPDPENPDAYTYEDQEVTDTEAPIWSEPYPNRIQASPACKVKVHPGDVPPEQESEGGQE